MPVATMTFLGAAQTVTGSKYLLEIGGRRILVDAGMFQGEKQWRLKNWEDFPVPPDSISDIILTHAHMDHCGYLPALVKHGFDGPVWCTAGTKDLAAIVLRDAGFLAEREAQDAAQGGWSKHNPPLPIYTPADVERTLPLLTPVDFDADADLGDDIWVRFTRAGHILGSSSVTVRMPAPDGMPAPSVLFSGDLGRHDHPVLRPRDIPPGSPVVVIESTYGDREHPEPVNLPHEALADVIRRTVQRGGSVLIPAFAIDRTEVVMRILSGMREDKRIPDVPIYINSPMATAGLEVYRRDGGELRADLDLSDFARMSNVHEVRSAEESMELTRGRGKGPSIIISSSGMVNGGRVLHHLERMLPDDRNAIVLTGYQSVGTRGRALMDGATQLKMHGRYIPVRAEIVVDREFSVHADASDLIDWLRDLQPQPGIVYVTHGEEESSEKLAARIHAELGLVAVAPGYAERVVLDAVAAPPVAAPAAATPSAPAAPEGAAEEAAAVAVPTPAALAGLDLTGASITSDLTASSGQDGEIVLDGTITIRLRPRT
ncbi:Exonuclease of the beta-lactamase fold involved in RNA processing [Nostocoides australiense Ben110]|uniref:Exonuclease of the beta-lactamase fold involved in RNA processing n=1 Tax=Nostocoides australiense Ben110 TaxID=1193182 RepID=W6K3A5_9MICO|nr:MBL fold metallo-hydrolase [Tetrasphaera australiensis]CCH72979.1 Exonuclease of the beta-lactamase fold involved in RNA processing [Tetrasphaera australiensis Ben110]